MNRNTEQAFFLNQNSTIKAVSVSVVIETPISVVGGRRVHRSKVSKVETIRAKEAHMAEVTLSLQHATPRRNGTPVCMGCWFMPGLFQ